MVYDYLKLILSIMYRTPPEETAATDRNREPEHYIGFGDIKIYSGDALMQIYFHEMGQLME